MGADLGGADLVAADLTGAYISFADPSEDEIKEAMLPYLTQRGFTLIGGNPSAVREANLKGAIGVTLEELEKQAKSLEGATMPDGSIHP